ncbi:hypothetical protein CDIK_0930 [Cucumispora dikerogammari]|nr:hypothetical protein CDIK_0930 [Cucumispora dikerogammari]
MNKNTLCLNKIIIKLEYLEKIRLQQNFRLASVLPILTKFIKLFSQSAVLNKIYLKIKRRNKKRIELKCDTQQCLFYVAAYFKLVINRCIITKMNPSHLRSCCLEAKFNTSIIKKAIEDNQTMINTSVALINQIKSNTEYDLKYTTAY